MSSIASNSILASVVWLPLVGGNAQVIAAAGFASDIYDNIERKGRNFLSAYFYTSHCVRADITRHK